MRGMLARIDRWLTLPERRPGRAIAAIVLLFVLIYGASRWFMVPQGDEFMRGTSPALGSVLFSDWHGLFTWTPVIIVSIAGLVLLARREAMVATALGVVLIVSWDANAAVADWWAGEAYGARRFVSCFPIFVIGLSAAIRPIAVPFARLRRWLL